MRQRPVRKQRRLGKAGGARSEQHDAARFRLHAFRLKGNARPGRRQFSVIGILVCPERHQGRPHHNARPDGVGHFRRNQIVAVGIENGELAAGRSYGAQHFLSHAPAVDQCRHPANRGDRQNTDNPFGAVAHHHRHLGALCHPKTVAQGFGKRGGLGKGLAIGQPNIILHHHQPVAKGHGLMVNPRQITRRALEQLLWIAGNQHLFQRMGSARAQHALGQRVPLVRMAAPAIRPGQSNITLRHSLLPSP